MGALIRVLIVDDDALLTRILSSALRLHAMDVRVAAEGEAGWRQVLSFQPHLVILDVMMPRMDGCELCRRIKRDARTAGTPVLMFTALGAEHLPLMNESLLTLGADGYLTKPIRLDELLRMIDTVLDREGADDVSGGAARNASPARRH
jgi:DNA-binding response OmpR family regulator